MFDLESFHTVGYVKLPGIVPRDTLEGMLTQVWMLMGEQGYERHNPASWGDDSTAHHGVKYVQKLQKLKLTDTGATPEDFPEVREAMDLILGDNRTRAKNWGQSLVTLPLTGATWQLPGTGWHFDHVYRYPRVIWGINVFLFMDDVEPGGGGTAVLRNSPLLIDKLLLEDAKFGVREQNQWIRSAAPWLRGLKAAEKHRTTERTQAYLEGTEIEGIEVRVEELTGKAGDVFVSHPGLLHVPAMNVSDRPRMMRTQRVHRIRPTEKAD